MSRDPKARSTGVTNQEKLSKCLSDIRENRISIRQAAVKYGIPKSTLHDRLRGKVPEQVTRKGPDPYLSVEEEEETQIANWCVKLSKCGFPLKEEDLLNTVQKIIKDGNRKTPFNNNRPGKTWVNAFFRRNPILTKREPENITKGRAAVTELQIKEWFNEFSNYLKSVGQEDILNDPTRILNGDESSFSLCPKTGKVIAPKGFKNVYQIQTASEKDTLTVLIVFSADGKLLPPMVIFPYIRPPRDFIDSMPHNWFLGRTENGWMRSETFFEYVANCVHKWLDEESVKRPVVLFVDGHKSHLTMELSKFCDENGIILYALPPNTTHIMQPADVSVFKPLKSDWAKTVRDWQSENVGEVLTRKTFCPLLEKAILRNQDLPRSIKNVFRKCGLFPFDPNAVDFSKCVKDQLEKSNEENIQGESEENITATGFQEKCEISKEIITFLKDKLNEKGVNTETVLNVIGEASSAMSAPTTEVLTQNTSFSDLRVGVIYEVQPDGNLHSTGEFLSSPTETTSSTLMQSANDPCSSSLFIPTSTRIHNSTLKLPQMSDLENVEPANNDPCSTSSLTPISTKVRHFAPKETSFTTTVSRCLSRPSIKKHLVSPSGIFVSKKRKVMSGCSFPSAISSNAWRKLIQEKDEAKQRKIEEIKKRKESRLIKKAEKEQKVKIKRNRTNKKKEKCNICYEELISDVEDDNMKNIGCDICPNWYHLKCTSLKCLNYNEAIEKDFICPECTLIVS